MLLLGLLFLLSMQVIPLLSEEEESSFVQTQLRDLPRRGLLRKAVQRRPQPKKEFDEDREQRREMQQRRAVHRDRSRSMRERRPDRPFRKEDLLQKKMKEELVRAEQLEETIARKEFEQQKEAQEELVTTSFKRPKKKKKEEDKSEKESAFGVEQAIFLNFEKIKLSSFIHYIGGLKKLNVIPDKGTDNVEISIVIREPLTVDGAWQIFLTILELYGFSIVEIGPPGNPANVFKVIPRGGKKVEPWKSFIGVPAESLPDTDMTIRYVCFLTNISVGEVSGLLDSMLGPDHLLVPQPNVNGFIITDKVLNIKAAMKIINELDQSGLQEMVVVKRLNKSNAIEVKALLEKLITAPEGNTLARLLGKKAEGSLEYFSSSTKIVAEERSNVLILLGNQKAIQTIEDFIDKYFEVEERITKSPFKKFRFKYAEATQMRDLLTEVVNAPIDTPAGKSGGVFGGVKYFKNINFQVDERSNTLYVTCADQRDWKVLKPTLKALDVAQPSVAIETLIVSVDITDDKELGGQFRPQNKSSLGGSVGFQSAALSGIIPERDGSGNAMSLFGYLGDAISGSGRGSTVLSFANAATGNIWAVFRALKSETNASVLSQPFVTVANRVKAVLESGATRRIVKETAISDSSGNPGGAKSYTNQDALTHIEYTPQINLDGIINLKVDINLSDFGASEAKTVKTLGTNVSIASGQVLVLGGFVKTSVTQNENQTPFLSKIPILGWLAKNKERNIAKQYVFIFACPTIIKPRQTPGVDLYTKIKLHDAEESIDSAIDTRKTKDPIHNWFFNPDGETYSHKVVDFATARYQPSIVDIKNDPEYRLNTAYNEKKYGESYNSLDPVIKEIASIQDAQKKLEKSENIVLTRKNEDAKQEAVNPEFKKGREALKKVLEFEEELVKEEKKGVRDQVPSIVSIDQKSTEVGVESSLIKAPEKEDFLLKDSRNRLKDILSLQNNASSVPAFRRNA